MSIVTGTVSNGITLGQAGFTSPLLVTHAGTVSNSTGAAVYASDTYANPVVLNQGTILDTGGFAAVALKDGGIVANLGNSALSQGYTGIYISGAAGVVTNSGTIAGTGAYGGGVVLEAGGSVQNRGLIEGGPTVPFYRFGYTYHTGGAVSIGGGAGTVSNSGTIVGTGVPFNKVFNSGVFLAEGGSVDNRGVIQGGINISNSILYLYYLSGGGPGGAVTNSGTITGTLFGGILSAGSGSNIVKNTGLIEGYFGNNGVYFLNRHGTATITNSGTITGVNLRGGGSVQNSGLIQAGYGVVTREAATVANSGTIIGTGAIRGGVVLEGSSLSSVANTGLIEGQGAGGVYISFGYTGVGAVTNTGTIEGTGSDANPNPQRRHGGVFLGAGGSVGNSGLIQGLSGVYVGGAPGSVTNSGVITGTGLAGVILAAGGSVTDSGTIIGGNGTAVSFGGNGGNLLALEAGYNLVGAVTVAGAANTLELLGAAGAVTVDFDKSGAGFGNFGTVAFAVSGNHTETLAITDDTLLPGIISGFTQRHDIVDLTQLAPKHATATLNAGDRLVVGNGGQSVLLQLDPSGNYSGVVWLARPDGSGGTDVAVLHPGDPAPPAASSTRLAATTDATFGSTPAPHYKNGASLSQLFDGGTPLEHLMLASGHGPPLG